MDEIRLLLVRHGQAGFGVPDRVRPLTPTGAAEVERLGAWLRDREVSVAEILHSGLTRARQTAEILGRHLKPPSGIRETSGLTPDDDPGDTVLHVAHETRNLALVTHLPFVADLASMLRAGGPPGPAVSFAPGTAACFRRVADGWSLEWSVAAGDLS